MGIRPEVLPFIGVAVAVGMVVALVCGFTAGTWAKGGWSGAIVAAVLALYLAYFFRDPERTSPTDPSIVVAGADGTIANVVDVVEPKYLKTEAVRVSIFLSLFDVHVNRAPIEGMSTFLGYFPGKHIFTFREKSSDYNQHNAILIEGQGTRCLVTQIVGPVARRVVYWLDHSRPVKVEKGTRIGMMKFGSRLDMYFPRNEVEIRVRVGDKVRAGETVVAVLRKERPS